RFSRDWSSDVCSSDLIEPRWDGATLYFISDRENKIFNVFRFDPQDRRVQRLSDEAVWDVRSMDVHDGTIVYEAGGRLKELDTAKIGRASCRERGESAR